jgi:hypothetical protein
MEHFMHKTTIDWHNKLLSKLKVMIYQNFQTITKVYGRWCKSIGGFFFRLQIFQDRLQERLSVLAVS